MAFALNIVYQRNSAMPGRKHWTLIIMNTRTEGTEFGLRGTAGHLTFSNPGKSSSDPTRDEGFILMIPGVGKIENRRYGEFCSIVQQSPILNHQPQWTSLDWVVKILEELNTRQFVVKKYTKSELLEVVERQMKASLGRR